MNFFANPKNSKKGNCNKKKCYFWGKYETGEITKKIAKLNGMRSVKKTGEK